MKVAVLGLGNMGSGIANRIVLAGHETTVWNRTTSKMTPLVKVGAAASACPHEAVFDADVVLTILMDDQSVLDSVQGPLGFLNNMKPGAIHLCATTISPVCAQELDSLHRSKKTYFVSGPVVGRPDSAASGELITFLAGDAAAIETISTLCAAYARKIFRMPGRCGAANEIKLCINYMAVSIIELMGEIYCYGEKRNLDTNIIKDLFFAVFAAPALKAYASKIQAREFSSAGGFSLEAGLKDVRLMLAASSAAGVSFDLAKVVEIKMLKAIDRGKGQADWSVLTDVTRQESGLL
jgi:3-hydroxyisobutyrate dehydrogenase-like beta-hydroxyacid dehydrogenase